MSDWPELKTLRTSIRLPDENDASSLWLFRMRNREHLAPWEPLRADDYFTLEHCLRAIDNGREAAKTDRGFPFAVFSRDSGEIIATFTLAQIMRGPFQACLLGYGLDARHQGLGIMHEALEAGLAFAFGELALHRVMANHLPRNERSAHLLQRLGFEREGYAKRYLKIAGIWEDHVLTARTNPDG